MKYRSLRLRLLAGAAVAIFVALALAWAAMTFLFQRQFEQRVAEELRRDALQIVAGLTVDASGAVQVSQQPSDPRFVTPASGLYWQVSDAGMMARSRSLWDQALAPSTTATAADWLSHVVDGPFGHRLFLVERLITLPGRTAPLLVQVALNEDELQSAQAEFGGSVALFLAVLWVVLAGAAWVQVHLGLKPLDRLRRELATLRQQAGARLSADYPAEVEPLTRAINDFAGAREADVRRARQRAADLAHGLKTPLAALSAQSRLIRAGEIDAPAAAEGLDRAIAAAAAAVEGELARARAAAARHATEGKRASPAAVAQRLIRVLERTEKGMQLDFPLDIPEGLALDLAEEDLTEMLGPLLENAVRFARRQVKVSAARDHEDTLLAVEDDGPGIDAAHIDSALVRGGRLDQAGGGYGLGLSIARELAEATGGEIALGVSSLGGLRVELRWRAATGALAEVSPSGFSGRAVARRLAGKRRARPERGPAPT